MLEREEYIEQAHLFRTLGERLTENVPMQELLEHVKQEILSTTRLPLAIDFLLTELRHIGMMSTAMERLPHYFTPFQTYVMQEAEAERGRFDLRIAVDILRHEAEYRGQVAGPAGDVHVSVRMPLPQPAEIRPGPGGDRRRPDLRRELAGVDRDLRQRIGMVDFADMIYVRSQFNLIHLHAPGEPPPVAREAGALQREGRQNRLGQPPQGPALSVLRPCSGTWAIPPCRGPSGPTNRSTCCRS